MSLEPSPGGNDPGQVVRFQESLVHELWLLERARCLQRCNRGWSCRSAPAAAAWLLAVPPAWAACCMAAGLKGVVIIILHTCLIEACSQQAMLGRLNSSRCERKGDRLKHLRKLWQLLSSHETQSAIGPESELAQALQSMHFSRNGKRGAEPVICADGCCTSAWRKHSDSPSLWLPWFVSVVVF